MFNVFSNYLSPLIEAKMIILGEQPSMKQLFDQLRIAYNQGAKGIENCVRLFVPDPEKDEELVEYIYNTPDLLRVVRWTNQHILLRMGTISYPTIGVHLRIICSMLVKLKTHGVISEEKYTILHSNLTQNVWAIHCEIINDGLPFLPRQPNLDWYSSGAQPDNII